MVHTGDGDGWDINRPAMSSIVLFQGRVYLIDAGPNIQASLDALGIGVNDIEGVFQTHCHDDHFAGLTQLMCCDRRIRYFAVPMVRATVAKKLAAMLGGTELEFRDFFEVRDLQLDEWNEIDGLEVKPDSVAAPGRDDLLSVPRVLGKRLPHLCASGRHCIVRSAAGDAGRR